MKTTSKNTYQFPELTRVELDNEIALTLDSSNFPIGDPESMVLGSELLMMEPIL
jgi:hypothetical protein